MSVSSLLNTYSYNDFWNQVVGGIVVLLSFSIVIFVVLFLGSLNTSDHKHATVYGFLTLLSIILVIPSAGLGSRINYQANAVGHQLVSQAIVPVHVQSNKWTQENSRDFYVKGESYNLKSASQIKFCHSPNSKSKIEVSSVEYKKGLTKSQKQKISKIIDLNVRHTCEFIHRKDRTKI